jgi:hypothetical protein
MTHMMVAAGLAFAGLALVLSLKDIFVDTSFSEGNNLWIAVE